MWTYRNDTELTNMYQQLFGEAPPSHFLRLVDAIVMKFERQLNADFDYYEPDYHAILLFMVLYYSHDLIKGRMKSEKIGDYSYTRFGNDETPPEWYQYYTSLLHEDV